MLGDVLRQHDAGREPQSGIERRRGGEGELFEDPGPKRHGHMGHPFITRSMGLRLIALPKMN